MATRFAEHLLTGDHASRPAATTVPEGTLYACEDHTLIYQSDTATWTTWIDPGGSSASPFVLPSFVAAGTSATGTGDITPGLPAGHTTDDILLLFVQTNNQAATAPAGWAQLGPMAGIGTAAAAGGTRLYVFWKRHDGSETDPTVTDTGDHTLGQIIAIRGCVTSGNPFLNVGSTRKTTASTTGTASPGATPVDNCLIVNAFAHALDSASAVFSSFTNADLDNVTERIDVATADGNGGGIGVCTGEKVTAGNFAATTVNETSTTDVSVTFIMLPEQVDSRAGFIDRQVFLTPGVADTWTRPTAAKRIHITLIGGGGSGSAGRNAATAAGGGGGGGGAWKWHDYDPNVLPASSATVTAGAGGAATANTDGAAGNNGNASSVVFSGSTLGSAGRGNGGAVSASGSGGAGGDGGGVGSVPAGVGVRTYGSQATSGGTGGTTAAAGAAGSDFAGGAGAGGGTTQAASAGGSSFRGGGGGGGGRSNTNVGTGGASWLGSELAGGSTAGANGNDSTIAELGGSGAAGGTSAAGPGGTGGWPGGGGGGGGSQSGAQRGGAGGDGVVVITTFC